MILKLPNVHIKLFFFILQYERHIKGDTPGFVVSLLGTIISAIKNREVGINQELSVFVSIKAFSTKCAY